MLVPVADPSSLAGAITDLLAAPDRRAALGRAGSRRAREHFDLPGIAARYVAAYEARNNFV